MPYRQEQVDEMEMCDVVEAFIDQEASWRLEGRRGVEALGKLAQALGYKDPYYQMQMPNGTSIGDVLMMLEDNSGMINAMIEWVQKQRNVEWKQNLKDELEIDGDEEEPCED